MSTKSTQVWECEHHVEVAAPPCAVWSLLSDVSTWPAWNPGVARIDLDGPFAARTRFTMTRPDGAVLPSRLVEVQPNKCFLDETRLADLRVFVEHRLEPLAADRTRIVFALEAFGATCDEHGPSISADFPAVLKNLAAHAEALARAEC